MTNTTYNGVTVTEIKSNVVAVPANRSNVLTVKTPTAGAKAASKKVSSLTGSAFIETAIGSKVVSKTDDKGVTYTTVSVKDVEPAYVVQDIDPIIKTSSTTPNWAAMADLAKVNKLNPELMAKFESKLAVDAERAAIVAKAKAELDAAIAAVEAKGGNVSKSRNVAKARKAFHAARKAGSGAIVGTGDYSKVTVEKVAKPIAYRSGSMSNVSPAVVFASTEAVLSGITEEMKAEAAAEAANTAKAYRERSDEEVAANKAAIQASNERIKAMADKMKPFQNIYAGSCVNYGTTEGEKVFSFDLKDVKAFVAAPAPAHDVMTIEKRMVADCTFGYGNVVKPKLNNLFPLLLIQILLAEAEADTSGTMPRKTIGNKIITTANKAKALKAAHKAADILNAKEYVSGLRIEAFIKNKAVQAVTDFAKASKLTG